MRSSLSLHLEFGITVGSLDAASGPAACRFFLRPTRVVGGGGSYFGFSFYSGVKAVSVRGILRVRRRRRKLHEYALD